MVCPPLQVALIDGAIRRKLLIDKAGAEAEQYFERIFFYGCEQYMIPRFASLNENLELIDKECSDPHIRKLLGEELEACLTGTYYTDELLDVACEMNAKSVNLWYRTITQEFIDKAHNRGLAVLVFTVNGPDDLQALSLMGVDGIFTDYYSKSASSLASYVGSPT